MLPHLTCSNLYAAQRPLLTTHWSMIQKTEPATCKHTAIRTLIGHCNNLLDLRGPRSLQVSINIVLSLKRIKLAWGCVMYRSVQAWAVLGLSYASCPIAIVLYTSLYHVSYSKTQYILSRWIFWIVRKSGKSTFSKYISYNFRQGCWSTPPKTISSKSSTTSLIYLPRYKQAKLTQSWTWRKLTRW